MKLIQRTILFILALAFWGCGKNILDKKPLDKLSGEALFSDPEGVKVYMANLYYQLPVEDFTFFRSGFNVRDGENLVAAMLTDEAIHSEYADFLQMNDFSWWDQGYKLIRDVNILIGTIPSLNIPQDQMDALVGESAFIRAYAYFALAKRYGGVPLITTVQKYEGDIEALKVPRSSEKETWDFILKECDSAINNLPDAWPGGRRASKWAAYALKSRVALYAASIAKFGERAPLSGDAVSQKLVGIDKAAANGYYEACIKACEAIIGAGKYSLYSPTPTSPEEAAENYRKMFEDPSLALNEAIFIKGFASPGDITGHNYDIWYQPAQTTGGWPFPGRLDPTLELMDTYENYATPGQSAPIITTISGNDVNDYNGFNPSKQYKRFDKPYGIFIGKDARLWGTAVLPGTQWKGQEIIIQAGFIKPDGTPQILSGDPFSYNGKTYYTYGAADAAQYSGFDPNGGDYTRTGASFKKFLNQKKPVAPTWNQSVTDYMDFRFAEILLNYAEAVVESGYAADNTRMNAAKAINDIRHRAGHTVDIPLSVENVQRERVVELAFENKRIWDLIRRREYHTLFNNKMRHALLPVLDLRVQPAQYIFIRANVARAVLATFDPKQYYRPIPGIGSNGLVQNPQY